MSSSYNPWQKHGIKRHMVLVSDPDIKSYAAQIKLRIQLLREAMKTGDEHSYWSWMRFRANYLAERKVEMGGMLFCEYCGKKDLKADTKDNAILATVDHVVPTSKGGGRYDTKNMCVACFHCNQVKGDKVFPFLMRVTKETVQ